MPLKTSTSAWGPREVLEELTEPLSINYQQSCLTIKVLVDWRLATVKQTKRGRERIWETTGLSARPLCQGKVTEQTILTAITWHMQDNQGIRSSQHGFMKGRCCLTNLTSFYDRVTHLEDERKAMDMFYLGFSLMPSK